MIIKYFIHKIKRNFSTATIWIKGGSDMDSDNKKGINHILCSLLTRGCEGFDNLAISDYLESYGAELNHDVFEDGMSISIKSLNEHFDKIFPLINLIVNKPILSEIEFQKVKKLTINSIKKEKENPFNISFEKWRKIVYSKHPYAFNSIGYESDVKQIMYEDVLSEYEKFRNRRKYLISNNLKINPNSFEESDQIISGKTLYYQNPYLNKEHRFVNSHNKSNQTIIMLGNQTCSRRSSEYLPLKLLESHLSYGMSSLLFKVFREKNGITYDIGVFNPVREGNAPFLIYLSVSNKNALLAFELLTKLWNELLFSLISDEDIFLAKKKLISSFLLNNQSLDYILLQRIQLISYGILPKSDRNYQSKIDKITPEDIQILTKKYFSRPFLSVNGSKKICNEINQKWVKDF